MPRQHGAEMSNDRQTSVVIEVVKSSATKNPKRGLDMPIFKKNVARCLVPTLVDDKAIEEFQVAMVLKAQVATSPGRTLKAYLF